MTQHYPMLQRYTGVTTTRRWRNERIFRFVCLESVACDAYPGARPRRGRSAVALAEDLSVRPVPARTALYARSWSEGIKSTPVRPVDVPSSISGTSVKENPNGLASRSLVVRCR